MSEAPQKVLKRKNGGRRFGAGEPKGKQMARRKALTLRERFPIFPLEHMMKILNAPDPEIERPAMPVKDDDMTSADYKELMLNYRKLITDCRAAIAAAAAEKMEAAKAAAPYIHPRLAAVEVSDLRKAQVKQVIDVTKLSDDELAFLEKVIMKSQTTTLDNDLEELPPIEFDDSGLEQ